MQVYCRWAPSLGELEGTHQEVWGTVDYTSENRKDPTVFFGLYDLRDYIALARHKGIAWVLWAGSDITNLENGFTFNDGKLKTLSKYTAGLFTWLVMKVLKRKNVQHWVENMKEYEVLEDFLPDIYIRPSFLGKVEDYKIKYKHNDLVTVWASCGRDRQVEYGFDQIERIADQVPDIHFHLFGDIWETKHSNVHVHGRVDKWLMNELVRGMSAGLRLNYFDGFSEVIAKSLLWGQYPISRIPYPYMDYFRTDWELVECLKKLKDKKNPNKYARQQYLKKFINNFPWNVNKQGTYAYKNKNVDANKVEDNQIASIPLG